MKRTLAAATAVIVFQLGLSAKAADWPQFRGPSRDGSTAESILTSWPKEGPKVLWKIPLGESFGSFVVRDGKAYCFMERDQMEACVAFDAKTGKELWATPIDKTIFEHQGGNGPRSTPTVDGQHVYLSGTYLKLACLEAADGKVVWQRDLVKDFNGQINTPQSNESMEHPCSRILPSENLVANVY